MAERPGHYGRGFTVSDEGPAYPCLDASAARCPASIDSPASSSNRKEVRSATRGHHGFSAGGQLAAFTTTRFDTRAYDPLDAIDATSCRPDFSMLIYPWQLLDGNSQLSDEFPITAKVPPTFLVHTMMMGQRLGTGVVLCAAERDKSPRNSMCTRRVGTVTDCDPSRGTSIHKWIDPAAEWLKLRKIVPRCRPIRSKRLGHVGR